jgi:hypothetical protein
MSAPAARPKRRRECTRDPAAGPGTCWWWWEGCPDAERRTCFVLSMNTLRRDPAHA